MVQVKCEYLNVPSKSGRDYFIFTDIEVMGHAETLDMSHTTGIKVCAGISACCYGIRRLLDDNQFNHECRKGYFHVWTDRTKNLKPTLDRDSVHALNTLVCQLFEIYNEYPMLFTSFDLIDVKEKIENERKREQQFSGHNGRPRKRNLQDNVGLYSLIEKARS